MADLKTCSKCQSEFQPFRPGSVCRPCYSAQCAAYYQRTREHKLKIGNEWRAQNRERVNAQARERSRAQRLKAIEIMGGICVTCGVVDDLYLDHIMGGGSEHRRCESNNKYYARIVREGRDPLFQVLCGGCHAEKTSREISESNRENPRTRRR